MTMVHRFDRLVDALLPGAVQRWDPDEVRRARLVVGASLAVALWGPPFFLIYLLTGPPAAAVFVGASAVAIAVTPWVLRRTHSSLVAGHWHTFALFVVVVGVAALTGGPYAPALQWSIAVPMVAVALCGPRSMLAWLPPVIAVQCGFWSVPNE